MVEMAGIEPASERDSEKTSTSVAYALVSRELPVTSNLPSRYPLKFSSRFRSTAERYPVLMTLSSPPQARQGEG